MRNILCAVLVLLMLPRVLGSLTPPACRLQFRHMDHYYQEGDLIIGGILSVRTSMISIKPDFESKPYGMNTTCRIINMRNYQNLLAFVFAIAEINSDQRLLPNTTLGFHIMDSCYTEERAVMGMLGILSGSLLPVPNYKCGKVPSLVGFVEGISSKVTLLLARLFQFYRIPQISYASLDTVLSDKTQFPAFYRTVPNDLAQFQAIVKLVTHFDWSWVGLLVSDNESGLEASQALQKGLHENGACVAFLEFVPYHDALNDKKITQIVNSLRVSSANAVILYGDRDYMFSLQIILYNYVQLEKVWIISSQWDISAGLDYKFLSFQPFNGSLAFTFHGTEIPNFENFFLNINPDLHPNDIFIKNVWWELFFCVWGGDKESGIGCTGHEDVTNSSDPSFSKDISVHSYTIYNAALILANALHLMDSHDKEVKHTLSDGQFWKLPKYLKNVNFTNSAGAEIDFNDNGDLRYSEFDVLNWVVSPDEVMNAIKVGRFRQQDSFQELLINENQVRWSTGFTQTPRSKCSETCSPGTRKAAKKGLPSCCYDCNPCTEGEISNQTDMEKCFKCPDDMWPNTKKDACVFKPITYLSYEEPLGKSLAAISVLLTLLTFFITMLFIKNQGTPIVKANNQNLSFVLLVSLKMCFLCILIFIGRPQNVTCILRQTVFGITFSVSVSCVLAKTVLVILAFNATKPGSKLRISSMISYVVVTCCVLIQVCVCVVWLATSRPSPYYNMEDELGTIVAECNEGSPLGFYSVLGYMGFLAFVSFLIAFLARNLPDIFNEAKYITFSMLVFCSVWISFIPAYLSTRGKYVVAVEIFAILASGSGLLGCIYIPKCYILLFRPDSNTKALVSAKRHSDSRIQ